MIPVRARGLPTVIRTYPSSTIYQDDCPACDQPFGDESIATVHIGPGPNPDDQVKAREGRWHTGAAVIIHAACAGVPAAETTP